MPTPALQILAGELGLIGYAPGFLTNPVDTIQAGLPAFGRSFVSLIQGKDPLVGPVPYGFISRGSNGKKIVTLRGTQKPRGLLVEWIDDFDAVLEQCPWAPAGCMWHRGFGRVYKTLNVDGVPLALVIAAICAANELEAIEGHSLAGPLATYAAGEAKSPPPILFASPKPGNTALRDYLIQLWQGIPVSYANPNDAVPKVPLTVDWPWKIEDFQAVTQPIELSPASVTPPIPSNWDDSHALGHYLQLLSAVP